MTTAARVEMAPNALPPKRCFNIFVISVQLCVCNGGDTSDYDPGANRPSLRYANKCVANITSTSFVLS